MRTNPISARRPRITHLLLLPGAALFAQNDPQPSQAAVQNAPIVLSPFVVTEDRAFGYRATNTVSGTRINTPLANLPLTINVITEEFLRDIGASNLMDAVRFSTGVIPGATSATGGAGGGAGNNFIESFTIRGQEVRFTYRDGVRRWRGSEPSFLDRIEVIKGPTAILYGQALPGGTLNQISKRPLYESQGSASAGIDSFGGYRAELDATGPLGTNKIAAFRFGAVHNGGDTFKDFEELAYTGVMGTVEVKPFKTTTIRASVEHLDRQVDNAQVNGTVAWRGPLNAGTTYVNGSIGQPIGRHPLNEVSTNPYGAPALGAYVDALTTSYTVTLEQQLAKGLDVRTSWNHSSMEVESLSSGNNDVNVIDAPVLNPDRTTVNAAPGDTVTIGGNSYVVGLGSTLAGNSIANATPGAFQNGVRRVAVYRPSAGSGPLRFVGNSLGAAGLFNPNQVGPRALSFGGNTNIDSNWTTDLTYSFELGETQHRVLAGYEWVQAMFDQRQTSDAASWVTNPNGSAIPGSDRNFHGVGYDIERGIPVDIFGNEWTRPGPVSNAFNGAKVRQYSGSNSWYGTYTGSFFDKRLHALAGFRMSDLYQQNSPTSARDEFSETVPQFGALYKVTRELGVYASYSKSFLLNNNRFTTRPPGAQNPGAYVPGELFPPQSGTGIDVGLKFELMGGRLSGNLTYFNITRTEIPILDPNVFDDQGNNVFYPGGEEEVNGVELEAFYQVSDALQFSGGITYTDSGYTRVTRGQDFLLNLRRFDTAEWQASLFGKYSFQNDTLKGLTLGGGGYYVGETLINPGRSFTNDAYVVFDVFASYSHKAAGLGFTHSLNVRNLLDEEYYTGFTAAYPPRGIYFSTRISF